MLLQCQKRERLTGAERRVIEYINSHANEVVELTITDIAQRAEVSISTVSRAIRKCGIHKLTDIRYKIVEGNYTTSNILEETYTECANSIRDIDIDAVMKVVEHIRVAKKIHVLARGVSQLIAKEFEFRLRCQGYQAITYQSGILSNFHKVVQPDDLVIFFSVKGSDESLLRAVAYAKKIGATVASCCGNEYSILASFSDIVICTEQYSFILNKAKKGSTYSRLGLQLMAQTIVECLE